MKELSIIEKANILGLDLNIYGDLENPLFLAKDIARAIEHSNTTKMLEIVGGSKGVTSGYYLSKGGKQEANFLTENQVYKILMRSDKPIAMEIQEGLYNFLKAWRKKEITVIPVKQRLLLNIIEADNDMSKALAVNEYENRYVKPLELENQIKTQQIAELQPKGTYYDLVLQCPSLLSITVIAKDYGESGQWLNNKLHELGVQYKQGDIWLLYQKYADKGYTKTKTQPITRSTGPDVKIHTYWTQKGRLFIYGILKNIGILPKIEKEDVA